MDLLPVLITAAIVSILWFTYIKFSQKNNDPSAELDDLKKDKNHGDLNFHNESAQNEIAPMMFSSNPVGFSIKDFFTPNYDNAKLATVHPQEDEIYIFPSKIVHSTAINKTDSERISTSADVSIVAKSSENLENLLTPIDKWMKF